MLDLLEWVDAAEAKPPRRHAVPHAALLAALASDGDSRLAIDPATGANRYLCPPGPAPTTVGVSSCTASPISASAFAAARFAFEALASAPSPASRQRALEGLAASVRARLLQHHGVAGLADIVLCPSGTDAALLLAALLASERPGMPVTNVIPCHAETGRGIALAVRGMEFLDGPADLRARLGDHARSLDGSAFAAMEVPLRRSQPGRPPAPRPAEALNEAFATAAAGHARPVVHLVHGSKTGLVAPADPPPGAEVVVDACQGRIGPVALRGYLARGWPVMVTGSKFHGGPPFCGALLLPRGRWGGLRQPPARLGVALRWLAALDGMDRFAAVADPGAIVAEQGAAIMLAIQSLPGLKLVAGMPRHGDAWHEQPTIFTFAMRRPGDPGRFRTAAELRGPYCALARQGFLLGQPVELGPDCGGLRIAIGTGDVADPSRLAGLDGVFAALADHRS